MRAGCVRAVPTFLVVACALWVGLACGASPAEASTPPSVDPLAAQIERLRQWAGAAPSEDENVAGIQAQAAPLLEDAAQALDGERRWLALSRLALVWSDVEAAIHLTGLTGEERSSSEALDREWRRFQDELEAKSAGASRPDLDGAAAAARAIGEAALLQARVYHEAAREYGAATAPYNGFFYLGASRAQLSLARLAAELPGRPTGQSPLAPRSVEPDIAALERELLAAYAPPLSIDEHPRFIRISALVKEARELDAAGLRHGALLRLLEARFRLSRLLHPDRSMDAAAAAARARAFESGLEAGRDATLARMFVEVALAAADDPDPLANGGEAAAAAIFEDVLPLYLRALAPAPPARAAVEPQATVTLVRWPYT